MRLRVVSVFLTLHLATAIAMAGVKLEQTGPLSDPGASEQLRAVLESTGYRVVAGDGVVCDVWTVKTLPGGAGQEVPGAVYTNIPESALIGVISFPKATTDFRGQGIKPGVYTLRYALHPADGNHLGISPIRDFLVMVPIADDRDPSMRFKFDQLMKMSAKAAGTNHPAVISLVGVEDPKQSPGVVENEEAHIVLVARVKSAVADMPIAIVVKGVGEH